MSEAPRLGGATKRPVYLLLALVAMILVGAKESLEGSMAIRAIHDPLSVTPSLSEPELRAFVQSVALHARVTLPIAIGQLLLGGALLLVSMKALTVRRASATFALQMLIANAALLVAGYALRQPVRAAMVNDYVASGLVPPLPGMPAEQSAAILRVQLWWSFRLELGLELMTIALCTFALTRKVAREVLAHVEPHPEEP